MNHSGIAILGFVADHRDRIEIESADGTAQDNEDAPPPWEREGTASAVPKRFRLVRP